MRAQYVRGTPEERFWAKVAKSDGCWEWQASTNEKGYGWLNVGGPAVLAHRFSWELHNGPIPPGGNVLHGCDNPPCVRPDHLHIGSIAQNQAEMAERGRSIRGTDHWSARLSDSAVCEIRRRYAAGGVFQRELAADHGVCRQTIGFIVSGKTWRHVEAE